MLVEFDLECRHRTANGSQILTVHVISHAVTASRSEAAQRNRPAPLRSVERVIEPSILAYSVRFRPVETDVVQSSQVFSAREHLRFINPDPLREELFARGRQIFSFPRIRARFLRPTKVRPYHAPDADGGREIILDHI